MAITQPVTQLDFDQIKADIISFIKTDTAFTDYNFEGSALNTIVDMLAYNTHSNAYYANMLHSESFLDTAQKRASVVSKAKELGYTPLSAICSTASVDILLSNTVSPQLLERGSTLTAVNEFGQKTFVVIDSVYSTRKDASTHQFLDVIVKSGVYTFNTFTVNTTSNVKSVFTIPNKNIDTSTLKVYVDGVEYVLGSVFESVPTTKCYFLQESYSEYFQIYFGRDIIGVQPVNGQTITITYLVAEDFSDSDNCQLFNLNTNFGGSVGITVNTKQVSFGGNQKETINSIKSNAVKTNTTKNRAVTSTDFESLVKNEFGFLKSVSVWGGEDNVPPVYGKVFISLQPSGGFVISNDVKNGQIVPFLRKYSVVTVIPELVDPSYTYIEFVTNIRYNKNVSSTSADSVKSSVADVISTYMHDINYFNSSYVDSTLTKNIIDSDPGIDSVDIKKKLGFKLTPAINVNTGFKKYLNNKIIAGSVLSSWFKILKQNDTVTNAITVNIREIPDTTSNILVSGVYQNVARLGLYSIDNTFVKDIGYVNLSTGEFSFEVNVYAYPANNFFINLRCSPYHNYIDIKRNQILTIDTTPADIVTGIADSNVVNVEIYGY